jgi:NTE family protein
VSKTLRQFWAGGDLWFTAGLSGHLAHAQNWLSVLHTRLFGASGHFRPRLWSGPLQPFRSLYDLTPMKVRLTRLVDFERLNSGEVRLSVAATDIETGELVIFDTAAGSRITIDHLLASCGFLPEFAPVEVNGRLLGDGGLAANAPIEAVVHNGAAHPEPIFVIDLFARDGRRPDSFEDALARKNDLMFGNQTLRRLEAHAGSGIGPVVYLSYRAPPEEAGPEKTFDLSRQSIADRWAAGVRDMKRALDIATAANHLEPLTIVR